MLRKEQEEEARVRDKIMEQRLQLDQTQALFLDSSRALMQVQLRAGAASRTGCGSLEVASVQ